MIVKCICSHEGQDLLHGKQNRVANPTAQENKVRCTACGTLVSTLSPSSSPKSKERKKGR